MFKLRRGIRARKRGGRRMKPAVVPGRPKAEPGTPRRANHQCHLSVSPRLTRAPSRPTLLPPPETDPVNAPLKPRIGHSACPHDCPSTCALDVELIDERTIGRVRGSDDND